MALTLEKLLLALPYDSEPEKLKSASLAKQGIQSLPQPLSFLAALRKLDLSGNSIIDCTPLAKLPVITQLDLSHNQVKSLEPLRCLTTLVVLNVSHNQLRTLEGLSKEVGNTLQALLASDNHLEDVSALQNTKKLNTLVLSHNPKLGKSTGDKLFEWTSDMASLKKLSLTECGLTTIPESTELPLVTELRLAKNSSNR